MSKIVTYTDPQGRMWAKTLPDNVPDSDAAMGFELGPPSLAALGLPLEVEVRLHNELFARRLWTFDDVRRRRLDIQGAIQSAFKVDLGRIYDLYQRNTIEMPPRAKRPDPKKAKGRK